MIGSNTLVVHKNNAYSVYMFGGFANGVTLKELSAFLKKHKPDAQNLSEQEAYQILASRQCCSEFEPHYSKFAGDALLFFDTDASKIIERKVFCDRYETAHPKLVESIARQVKNNYRKEKRKILKVYSRLETAILQLIANQQAKTEFTYDCGKLGNLEAKYSYKNPRVDWREDGKEIHFFEGHDNRLPGLNFDKWFLRRRENLTPIYKKYGYNGSFVAVYAFTFQGQKWAWDYRSDMEIHKWID